MSTIKELREQEKNIQSQVDATRKALYAERARLEPMETQLALLKKELSRIQRDLIAALQAKVNEHEAA